jgi:XTP/dITP diphosphohydrolase
MKPILVFATHNPNKVREIQEMIGDSYTIQSLTDIGCHEDIVEDAPTLEGNARIKAMHVVNHYHMDCFADDTGLEVNALGGAPGVLSARYAGKHGNAEANMDKLLDELQRQSDLGNMDRTAQFRTVICLIQDGKETLIEGICRGEIATSRSGQHGFGYDPIFVPHEHYLSFADMSATEKHAISHRGRAVRSMIEQLKA